MNRSDQPEYRVWLQMRSRYGNPTNSSFERYGGRGIKVCPKWDDSYEAFCQDMGPRPSSDHSIERVNNDLGYAPKNCVWATATEQANNRRTSSFLEFDGRSQTIAQWALELAISPHTLRRRLEQGWSAAAALSARPKKTGKRLSKTQLAELERLILVGQSNGEIAEKLGVSSSAVGYRRKKMQP